MCESEFCVDHDSVKCYQGDDIHDKYLNSSSFFAITKKKSHSSLWTLVIGPTRTGLLRYNAQFICCFHPPLLLRHRWSTFKWHWFSSNQHVTRVQKNEPDSERKDTAIPQPVNIKTGNLQVAVFSLSEGRPVSFSEEIFEYEHLGPKH